MTRTSHISPAPDAAASAAPATVTTPRWRRVRLIVFRVVMALLALMHVAVFGAWRAVLAPWVVFADETDHGWARTPELHRLADGSAGAVFVAIAAAAVVLAIGPSRRSGLAAWLAAALGLSGGLSWLSALLQGHDDVAGTLVFSLVWVGVMAAVFVWLHPEGRTILRGGDGDPDGARPAPWLLAVLRGVAVAGLLAAASAVVWRLSGGYVESPQEDDVFSFAYLGLLWAFGGSLAARARAGWRPLAAIALTCAAYALIAGASVALA